MATPLLYENIVIGRGRHLSTLCTVLEASRQLTNGANSLGHWTKRLDIAIRDSLRPPDEEIGILCDIIRCLPHLEIVTFSISSAPYHYIPSPPPVLSALGSTCAPTLKYIHWFRPYLVPVKKTLIPLLRKCPNLRSFHTPLISVGDQQGCHDDEFFHASLTTVHAETGIVLEDRDAPIPPQLMTLPSLRQLSFVTPTFHINPHWAMFLEKHGHQLQHIQVLTDVAESHFQSDLDLIVASCPNLSRFDLFFSRWVFMPFPVALPQSVRQLGIFCYQGQAASYHTFFSRLDKIEYGPDFTCIQFLGKQNVKDIFDKHSHQFWAGTKRLRGSGIRFKNHRGLYVT